MARAILSAVIEKLAWNKWQPEWWKGTWYTLKNRQKPAPGCSLGSYFKTKKKKEKRKKAIQAN